VAEKRYRTYEKEFLAVIFGCEKSRTYLEHKEFELHCDNLALCWLLKRVKDIGRLGRWILCLALFKFGVKLTRGIVMLWLISCCECLMGTLGKFPK